MQVEVSAGGGGPTPSAYAAARQKAGEVLRATPPKDIQAALERVQAAPGAEVQPDALRDALESLHILTAFATPVDSGASRGSAITSFGQRVLAQLQHERINAPNAAVEGSAAAQELPQAEREAGDAEAEFRDHEHLVWMKGESLTRLRAEWDEKRAALTKLRECIERAEVLRSAQASFEPTRYGIDVGPPPDVTVAGSSLDASGSLPQAAPAKGASKGAAPARGGSLLQQVERALADDDARIAATLLTEQAARFSPRDLERLVPSTFGPLMDENVQLATTKAANLLVAAASKLEPATARKLGDSILDRYIETNDSVRAIRFIDGLVAAGARGVASQISEHGVRKALEDDEYALCEILHRDFSAKRILTSAALVQDLVRGLIEDDETRRAGNLLLAAAPSIGGSELAPMILALAGREIEDRSR